jgi:hypothetical protein
MYVLFVFERLLDVRIVYAPPFALGNFGGDSDNYQWPRHTADFAILRCYVGPDGMPAPWSPHNVPYHPSKHLRFARHGAAPGDFVFLLGFPGGTQRWAPSCALQFDHTVELPSRVADLAAKLALVRAHCRSDRAATLKALSAKKSLANLHTRFSGQCVMMQRVALVRRRAREEVLLSATEPAARADLEELGKVYDELRGLHPTV